MKPKRANNEQRYEDEMRDFERNVIGTTEAAELLGVTKDHADELCKRGKIRCKRIGPHAWAIYRPSLKQYLKTKSRQGKPPSHKPKLEQ